MTTWSLAWTWAGHRGNASDGALRVTWSERMAMGPSAGVRSATMEIHPAGIDVLETAARPDARAPGYGQLYRNGVEVLRGLWRDVEYDDGTITLTIGDDEVGDDATLWPGPTSLRRSEVLASLFIQYRIEPAPKIGKKWFERPFVIYRITQQEVWGPVVFGAPGSTTVPGSPAYLLNEAAVDYGDGLGTTWRMIIARHRVEAATVRLWLPAANAPDQLSLDGHGSDDAGLYTVYHATDPEGFTYAFCSIPTPTMTGASFLGALPSPDRPAAVSWTEGDALPGGAGSVLVEILAVSSVRCDLPAWRAAADVLDRYQLAGYVDERVAPYELAAGIMSYLPVQAVHTLDGIAPQIHPWATTTTPRPIEAGRGLSRAGPIAEGYQPVTSVEVRYRFGPMSTDGASSLVLDADATPYGLAAASLGASRAADEVVRADWVWSASTAQRIAADTLRLSVAGRTVPYIADPALYGPGTPGELRIGQAVAVTDSGAFLTAAEGYVEAIEAADDQMRVTIVLRDDPLRGT